MTDLAAAPGLIRPLFARQRHLAAYAHRQLTFNVSVDALWEELDLDGGAIG